MKRRNKIALLVLFFFVKLTVSFAQIDTAFWFAVPWVTPDHTFRQDYVVHISTFNTPNTVVRLRQPGAIAPNKYDTTINIPANTNFDYLFWRDKMASVTNRGFDSLEVQPANTVLPYGLYISSSANITVVYDVISSPNTFYNPETFSLKGQNGMGLEFVCPFQTRWNNQTLGNLGGTQPGVNQPKQQINIVATQPNTVVWITPKCAVIGHPANITYSVMLPNYGSAYTVENFNQNTATSGNNLSGTIVVADKPISVTVADDSVSGVTGCYDLMGDQIVPVDIVGTDYILNKGYMNGPEHEGAYIVGTENFTQLTINDGVTTTTLINKGDTYHYKTTQALTYVNADKPVYCLHASGTGCELGEALLPPLNCAGSNLVSFSRTNNQGFYLNLLCKNGSQSTFTLNNSTSSVTVPITAANFTLVPGTATLVGGPFYGGQLNLTNIATLPIGSYTVANSVDVFALGVFGGNASTGGLFHYMSSFLRKTFVKTQTVTPYCVGSGAQVVLSGTVSGGAITGVWTTANGTGLFSPYTSTVNTIAVNYNLSPADTLLTSIKFYLTSTGNCTPKKDSIIVPILQRPKVAVGPNITICKNNLVPIVLNGTVSAAPVALGGSWSGGTGFFAPGTNITYSPTPADLAAGSLTLTLSSVGGCTTTVRSLTVTFVDPPTLTGFDNNICTNTQSVVLNSSVVGSTVLPSWTTSNGTGFFSPTNLGLNPTYSVSSSDYSLTTINFVVTLNPGLPCAAVTDNVQLTMRPAPQANAPSNFTVCANAGLINLNGSIGGSASTGTWSTLNGTGAFN
ncbi:MAG: IgGFc-binding protein, partial [Bacteroidia bacterium]|nr:IgGFc-binding protein [Bacteroidia bacterium]